MARLWIHTFGGLQIFDAQGQAIALPARKPAALMAYLALHPGRAQPRARLATLLWGSSGEAASRASLRQALLIVRRGLALSDEELASGPGETVTLAAGTANVDALDLEAAMDSADPDLERTAALIDSLDGEFLEGIHVRESAFDDWLSLRRSQLRATLVQAHARLLGERRARAQSEPAVISAVHLLALEPLREDVHRTLMALYAGQHRWGAALHQFQLCRDVLARELGVRPEPATLQLRDAIERQRMETGAAPDALPAGPVAPSAELRHVALLAIESARAAAEPDPEMAQALADTALQHATEVVQRFGGGTDRRPGAGLLACFGAPLGHADDDERAVRCARGLVDECPELRVGMAVGLMLVAPDVDGRRVQRAGGEVAGLASRLLAAAEPAEVLVSESLWHRLAARVEGQRCPDAALPAALRAGGVYRITAIRRASGRRTALVGRRAEIAQFASLVDACLRDGAGSVVHLRGEPGIGKSRLAQEFGVIAAGRGFSVHQGMVLDFGSGAERDAVRALVRDLLGLEAAATDGEAFATAMVDAAASVLGSAGLAPEDEAALRALLRQPLPPRLQAFDEARDHVGRTRAQRGLLLRLVVRSAGRVPRMLLLEDLHWADAGTLSYAVVLAGATAQAPVVLVTTGRSDADPVDADWHRASGLQGAVTFDLGPLRRVDAYTLASQLADAADPFTNSCVERADGNPLFLEQLLHAGPTPASDLPATLQMVVQARLDRLAGPEREALRVAAVLGQRFAMDAVDHLLGQPAGWNPQRVSDLLRVDGSDGVFAHALVRDGAYASLPKARRHELHASAARWYDGRDAMLHAEHLERAEDAGAALAWLLAAGAEARAHRHDRARWFACRGLDLAAPAGVRFELACCNAQALHDLGRSGDAHAAWQRALDEAQDDAGRCEAWIGIASTLRLRDDLAGAWAALDHAGAMAQALERDETRSRVHLLRGNLLFPQGDLDGCQREHHAALDLARRAHSAELEAAALGGLGDAGYLQGRMVTAQRQYAECVALAVRHGLRQVEAANRPMVAWTSWFAGDLQRALGEIERGIECARSIGHLRAEAIAHHIGCLARQAGADVVAARAHAQRALDLARRLESPRFEAEALAFLADLDATGAPAAALERLQAAIALARSSGMAFMGPVFLGILARVATDDATRRAALDEAEQLLAGNGLAHNHLLFRRLAVEACLATGDSKAIRHHADRLAERTGAEALPWSDYVVRRARALADRLDGAGEGWRADWAELIAEGDRLGLVADTLPLRETLRHAGP